MVVWVPIEEPTLGVSISMQGSATLYLSLGAAIVLCPVHLCALCDAVTFGLLNSDVSRPHHLEGQYGALVGFFYIYVGCLYFGMAYSMEFVRFSSYTRGVVVPVLILLLVLMGKLPYQILVPTAVDVASAAWTYFMLPPLTQNKGAHVA